MDPVEPVDMPPLLHLVDMQDTENGILKKTVRYDADRSILPGTFRKIACNKLTEIFHMEYIWNIIMNQNTLLPQIRQRDAGKISGHHLP